MQPKRYLNRIWYDLPVVVLVVSDLAVVVVPVVAVVVVVLIVAVVGLIVVVAVVGCVVVVLVVVVMFVVAIVDGGVVVFVIWGSIGVDKDLPVCKCRVHYTFWTLGFGYEVTNLPSFMFK